MDDRERVHLIFTSYREVNHAFYHLLLAAAQPYGITPVQLIVLKTLSERPHCTLSDLADRIQLGSSTTSGIVDRMEKAGLVVRERLESDRRAVSLSLTEEGESIWTRTNEARLDSLRSLLQMQGEELDRLVELNGKIAKLLQQAREEVSDE